MRSAVRRFSVGWVLVLVLPHSQAKNPGFTAIGRLSMAVPHFVRRISQICLVSSVALVGVAIIETWPAFSQSPGDHRASGPLARMTLGGPAEGAAPPLSPAIAPSTERVPDNTASAAARLLATARNDLAQGHIEIGQRVLEQIITRYPDSLAAPEARRELQAIEPALRGSATKAPADGTSPSASQVPPSQVSRPQISAWRTTVILFAKPQEELRNGIGDRVFFSAGSADLGSRARAVIAAQAEWLRLRPDLDIVVEGHADDTAAGADDESLSSSRATAVRNRLAAEGVAPERIRILPQGARDPIATCDDGTCAVQNRRAVVQVALPQPQPSDKPVEAAGHDIRTGDRSR
jgi:outer membrane protein OmpA-like peptidoglycan-associated protein